MDSKQNISHRGNWVAMLVRLAEPVLQAAAAGNLAAALKLQHHPDVGDERIKPAALEAFGRTLASLAPWFVAEGLDAEEARVRDRLLKLAGQGLLNATDPTHAGYLGFAGPERQTLVDAAFLALGLVRAPEVLWDPLSPEHKQQVHTALKATRNRVPGFSNWLLFSAIIETFLLMTDGDGDLMRIDYAIRGFDAMYVGDGHYGDGPEFHDDLYNGGFIHPFLTEILLRVGDRHPFWQTFWSRYQKARYQRYAVIQERWIAPDGSWPTLGRSITCRCGAFHTLALAALRKLLPDGLPPGQVRAALWATIQRTLGAAASWREDGFLWIGLTGSQPALGEPYITTGSLYASGLVFAPLGLSPEDAFWTDPELPWTNKRLFDLGENLPADACLSETTAKRSDLLSPSRRYG